MTNRTKILVVDDEAQLLSLVSYALETNNFAVETASTAKEAIEWVASHPVDLIVLDVVLPDGSGLELCKRFRRHTRAPVIFLTVMSDQANVIAGLEAGGDDYLAKPFSIEELILRINAVLRRSTSQTDSIEVGNLTLRLQSHELLLGDRVIDVTPLEFRFLRYLAMHKERIVPTSELIEEVWGVADLGAHDPIVKTVVYRVRQKLGDQSQAPMVEIRNVRGVGYQLRSH